MTREFKVLNEEHSIIIQERAFKLGFSWCGTKIVEHTTAQYLYINTNDMSITYSNPGPAAEGIYEKNGCMDWLFSEQPEVTFMRITSDYEATIFPEHIKVGCQEIPNETFEELVKLYNKTHKK